MKRPLLLPLVPLYAAGVWWKSIGFAKHPERVQRLREPVVSVGSISAGGAGKTPFVIALGEALRRAGYGIDVLSRGHGRTSQGDLRVLTDGAATEFGDEPLLIAQQLACPVYVARERFRAGQMAELDRQHRRDDRTMGVHLLDDGFQHRQLARAVDIVLLTAEDVRDALLPAGNLREPLRALQRADVIVLRAEEEQELRHIAERYPSQVWVVDRHFALTSGAVSRRPLAFCGIARPENFFASLKSCGIEPAATMTLRDHARYDAAAVRRIIVGAKSCHADGFATTAKDAVKLTAQARAELADVGPLAVADVRVTLRDEAACVAKMMQLIEADWMELLQRSVT